MIDNGLGVLPLSDSQHEQLEHIQNERMRTILEYSRVTSFTMMRYMLGLPFIRSRHRLAQIKAYI